jgi:predicted heme/steroid binding protein
MKKILFMLSLVLAFNTLNLSAEEMDHSKMNMEMKEFSVKELAKYNGKNGNPAYIAVDGVVYDVSNNKEWKNGEHIPTQGKLKAGIDASEIILKSPHEKSVLKELPVVGNLKNN